MFLAISILSISATGYLAYINSIATMKQETFDRLASTNVLKAAEVNRWVAANSSHLQSLAQRPLVRVFSQKLVDSTVSNEIKKDIKKSLLQDHFLPSISYNQGFLDLSVIDAEGGKVLASTEQKLEGKFRANRDFFLKGRENTFIGEMNYEVGLEVMAMHISTPVKGENNKTIAILSGHLNWLELSEIMAQGRESSSSEESYLVNTSHYFVTESRYIAGSPLKKTIHTKGVEDCLQGRGGVDLYNDYRDIPIIGSYQWLENWSLCILTEKDQAEAFEPAKKLRKLFILVGLAAFCLVALFSLLFARTIIRRINSLVTGVEEIGKGNLDYHLNVPGSDEIDKLATSFNKMAQARKKAENRIQKAHDLLEQRVQMRTAEISNKNIRLVEEIEERKQVENALRNSEKKYRTLLESLDTAVVVHDADSRIIISNARAHKMLGLSAQQMEGRKADGLDWHFLSEDGTILPTEKHPISIVTTTLKPIQNLTVGIQASGDEKLNWVSVNAFPEFDDRGELLQIVITFWDITFQKESEVKLQNSLHEKEVLLREIHHRVKNNMQMIQSLINLHANKMKSVEFKHALRDSNSRIKSMALIHETLYRSENLANLNMEKYFQQLVRHLIKLYNKVGLIIEITYEIEPIVMDMDSSIACGLIVNELVTNVLKYAFNESENNSLSIALRCHEDNQVVLIVADNGHGLPDKLENLTSESLGLKIVTMLAEDQLQGTISTNTTAGTRFEIRFPQS